MRISTQSICRSEGCRPDGELELPDIPCRYRGPNGSVLSSSHQFQDAAIRGRYRYLELHQKTKRVLPAPVTASGPAGR